jgi:hypothetical protein
MRANHEIKEGLASVQVKQEAESHNPISFKFRFALVEDQPLPL